MAIPTTATALVATVRGRTQINLTWINGADTDAQLIYRHTADVFGSASVIGSSVGTSYLDSSLTDGTTYYYWLLPIGSGGVGTQTSSVNGATLGIAGNPGTNIIQQILEAMEDRMEQQLPTDWHRLKYTREPAKNDKMGKKRGFGAYPSRSEPGEAAVFGSYTQTQEFVAILSAGVEGKGDFAVSEAERLLYQWADRIIRHFKATKLYESDVVVRIADPSIEAPEYLEDGETVILRVVFPIMYRNTLN